MKAGKLSIYKDRCVMAKLELQGITSRTRRTHLAAVEACMKDAMSQGKLLNWGSVEYWTDRLEGLLESEYKAGHEAGRGQGVNDE